MLNLYYTEYNSCIGNIIIGMLEEKIFWLSMNDDGCKFKRFINQLEKEISTKAINKNSERFSSKNPLILRLLKSKSISIIKDNKGFHKVTKYLDAYFNKEQTDFLDISTIYLTGTSFKHRVWDALKDIKWSETASYKDIARLINSPQSYRAVGNANGSNIIPIIVPCHRIIKSDGTLGGYSGGLEIKKKLLKIENIIST